MFSEKEIDMLTLASKHRDEYKVVVDNDSIWLERLMADEDGEFYVDDFNTCGYEFAYELLKYMGCNVEYC